MVKMKSAVLDQIESMVTINQKMRCGDWVVSKL